MYFLCLEALSFHPYQALPCRYADGASWWAWTRTAFLALLASGVYYSGAKSGFSLNTAAHYSGNSGCDCGKPTVYRGLVEWVLHVSLMVPKRITASRIIQCNGCANVLWFTFLLTFPLSRTACFPQYAYEVCNE